MSEIKSKREIERNLRERRRAVASDLRALVERTLGPPTTFRHPLLKGPRTGVPAWSIAAGAALGALFLRRPLWPLEILGRTIGLAAPLLVPLAASRLLARTDNGTGSPAGSAGEVASSSRPGSEEPRRPRTVRGSG